MTAWHLYGTKWYESIKVEEPISITDDVEFVNLPGGMFSVILQVTFHRKPCPGLICGVNTKSIKMQQTHLSWLLIKRSKL